MVLRIYHGVWCERRDSNSHGLPHWNLNPARLPIPPLSHKFFTGSFRAIYPQATDKWHGVNDGTRTHDDRNHNPGLYQLSYAHRIQNLHSIIPTNPGKRCKSPTPEWYGAPDRTRTCNLRLSLPATAFAALSSCFSRITSLGSGLYLHHFRWDTYSLYGSPLTRLKSWVSSVSPSPGTN